MSQLRFYKSFIYPNYNRFTASANLLTSLFILYLEAIEKMWTEHASWRQLNARLLRKYSEIASVAVTKWCKLREAKLNINIDRYFITNSMSLLFCYFKFFDFSVQFWMVVS